MSIAVVVRTLILASVGFVLGTMGISFYEQRSHTISSGILDTGTRSPLASACISDTQDQEEREIFFVSCGGLF